ncbi:MAG: glycosyltransferase [Ilumatobacteraceae bacterium]
MPPATIVVPCFNEVARLDPLALRGLARAASARVLLVDDGSRDGTDRLVRSAAHEHGDELAAMVLPRNVGKGEAVRRGMREAIAGGASIVGYYDADLATPPEEMARLVEVLRGEPDLTAVLGSRVALLGHRIERSIGRHYAGRMFATLSSVVLGLPIYDSQCGAKVFRAGAPLRTALAEPFGSRWAFDVELLARLLRAGAPPGTLREVPLVEWRDVGGSKLGVGDAITAGIDMMRFARRQRQHRHDGR